MPSGLQIFPKSASQKPFFLHKKLLYCCKMTEVGGWDVMCIFDLNTSKVKYELKVVLLHFWRVNVKTVGGFIYIPLADFFIDKTAP